MSQSYLNFIYVIQYHNGSFSRVLHIQQDDTPTHRAQETDQLLQNETPAFVSSSLWPPNSPDLNPVDYKINMQ